MKRILLTLTVALLAAEPAAMAADGPPDGAARIMPMRVDGDAFKPAERAAVDDAILQRLAAWPALAVVPPPAGDIMDLMMELECVDLDGDCLGAIGKAGQAGRVLHVELARAGGRVTATVRWVLVSAKAVTRSDAADGASLSEVAAAVAGLLERELGPPPAAKAPPQPERSPEPPKVEAPVSRPQGTLIIESNRVQAQVFVGDEYAGTGSAVVELPPGKHIVRVTHPGDEPQLLTVEVVDGQTVTRQVTLEAAVWTQREPVERGAVVKKRSDGWLVWVIVGAVVVAGAATGAAIAAGGAGGGSVGTVVLGLGGDGAWLDPVTQRGRR